MDYLLRPRFTDGSRKIVRLLTDMSPFGIQTLLSGYRRSLAPTVYSYLPSVCVFSLKLLCILSYAIRSTLDGDTYIHDTKYMIPGSTVPIMSSSIQSVVSSTGSATTYEYLYSYAASGAGSIHCRSYCSYVVFLARSLIRTRRWSCRTIGGSANSSSLVTSAVANDTIQTTMQYRVQSSLLPWLEPLRRCL